MGLIPENVTAETICKNCYREFGDHNYVAGSLNVYQCPVAMHESQYGFFTGGDPRQFHPDGESCSEKELTNHRKACQLWDEAEARGETPEPEKCPSGFLFDDAGQCVGHVLRAPYGIGVQVYEFQTEFEPLETDNTDE